MEHRFVGRSGLKVSEIGLGTNNFGGRLDEAGSRLVLERALEGGITLIDTADCYNRGESERIIGRFLGPRRSEVVLATKFGVAMSDSPLERGASRRWLTRAAEDSLRRLNTDYIDLLQVHFPDPATPIEETLSALDDLVSAGKVRYVGHSNFAAWQIADAQWTAQTRLLARPISAQHRLNLLEREIETEVLPAIRHYGLGLIPYFPLASGFLTGKYRPGVIPEGTRLAGNAQMANRTLTPANFQRLEALERFAGERGHALLELALGWLLSQSEVSSVIAGASTPDQLDQNLNAAGWRLSPQEMEEVGSI
ncbi:MAG TPA: aldo/keto reductase [Candidatus Nitrosotalea sp.]|nr:aldo/keto reductase [Candidatus Nitrosotalea sp.]